MNMITYDFKEIIPKVWSNNCSEQFLTQKVWEIIESLPCESWKLQLPVGICPFTIRKIEQFVHYGAFLYIYNSFITHAFEQNEEERMADIVSEISYTLPRSELECIYKELFFDEASLKEEQNSFDDIPLDGDDLNKYKNNLLRSMVRECRLKTLEILKEKLTLNKLFIALFATANPFIQRCAHQYGYFNEIIKEKWLSIDGKIDEEEFETLLTEENVDDYDFLSYDDYWNFINEHEEELFSSEESLDFARADAYNVLQGELE